MVCSSKGLHRFNTAFLLGFASKEGKSSYAQDHLQPACGGKNGTFTFCFVQVDDACSEILPTKETTKLQEAGATFEQNEGPKPGPENRQFRGEAWAYPQSLELALNGASIGSVFVTLNVCSV